MLVDGELYVTGRLKDLVVVRGRNHYPQDIEHTAIAAHPAVRPGGCAAFAVPGGDGERLVVVAEVKGAGLPGAGEPEVARELRAAIAVEHQVSVGDLVLTRPGRLPRTSSGKIRRAAARAEYLERSGDTAACGDAPSTTTATRTSRDGRPVDAFRSTNPDFERAVRDAVLTMPAAMHLGFTFARIAPGEVEIVQPYRPELTQHDGYVQGGVLGALADFAGGSAAGALLPPGYVNMTVDYTVKILGPARGDRVLARGRVVKAGHTTSVAAADVLTVDGSGETLCATALVTMRNVKLPGAGDPR